MALESFRGLLYRINDDSLISFFIRVNGSKRTYYTDKLKQLFQEHLQDKSSWQGPGIVCKSRHPLIPLQLLTFNETETEE